MGCARKEEMFRLGLNIFDQFVSDLGLVLLEILVCDHPGLLMLACTSRI